MASNLDDSSLYDSDDEIEELGEILDSEPVPSRRQNSAKAAVAVRNSRRSIEELQEERLLRSMLTDLDQEFPEL